MDKLGQKIEKQVKSLQNVFTQQYAQLDNTQDDDANTHLLTHVPSINNLTSEEQSIPTDSLLEPPPESWINPVPPVTPVSAAQFLEIVESVRVAIAEGVYPVRISQGSSGSYFCKNKQGDIVGVFKVD